MKTVSMTFEEYEKLKNTEEIYDALKDGNIILVQDFRQNIGNYEIPQTEFKLISKDKIIIQKFFIDKAQKEMKISEELMKINIGLQDQITKLNLKVFLLENNWYNKLCNKLK